MRVDYSRIPHADLARYLMLSLWRSYDAGGISCGRSMRCYLLELAELLTRPSERMPLELSELDETGLLKETAKRISGCPAQILLFGKPNHPTQLSNTDLVRALMLSLLSHYCELETQYDFEDPFNYDKRIVQAIIFLLGKREDLDFSRDELIEEAKSRERQYYHVKREEESEFLFSYETSEPALF